MLSLVSICSALPLAVYSVVEIMAIEEMSLLEAKRSCQDFSGCIGTVVDHLLQVMKRLEEIQQLAERVGMLEETNEHQAERISRLEDICEACGQEYLNDKEVEQGELSTSQTRQARQPEIHQDLLDFGDSNEVVAQDVTPVSHDPLTSNDPWASLAFLQLDATSSVADVKSPAVLEKAKPFAKVGATGHMVKPPPPTKPSTASSTVSAESCESEEKLELRRSKAGGPSADLLQRLSEAAQAAKLKTTPASAALSGTSLPMKKAPPACVVAENAAKAAAATAIKTDGVAPSRKLPSKAAPALLRGENAAALPCSFKDAGLKVMNHTWPIICYCRLIFW